MQQIHEIIKEQMKRKGITGAVMARRMETSTSQISRILSGKPIALSTLYKIADALGLNVEISFSDNRIPEMGNADFDDTKKLDL